MIDDYNITFESYDFTYADINLSNTFLSLREGIEAQITIMITVPENMKPGEYKIKFIAKSDMVSNSTSLTINVKDKDTETNEKKDNTLLFVSISIIIIIVIIILILLFLFVLKKKPKKDEIKNKEKPMGEQNVQPQISKYPPYQSQQQIQQIQS